MEDVVFACKTRIDHYKARTAERFVGTAAAVSKADVEWLLSPLFTLKGTFVVCLWTWLDFRF
jgi:hypothetical protein